MRPLRLAAAAALPPLWNNLLLPRLHCGPRGRTAANVTFATAYAAVFGGFGRIPVRGPAAAGPGAGRLRAATIPAAVVLAGYAVALAFPASRTRLAAVADRSPGVPVTEWVLVQIPWGTVYTEELVFRATLDPILESVPLRFGKLTSALLFGLWHIEPARAAGDDVVATVAATTAAGSALSELRRRTGSVVAPALVHLAANAGGAIAPRLARWMQRGRS
jgi:uncharacterized protein